MAKGLPPDGALAAELLRTLVRYDAYTGEFFWTKTRGGAHAGKKLGAKRWNGYIAASVLDRLYPLHRLAWLYVRSEWPKQTIDHINRIRDDNRIANLRDVSSSENSRNSARFKSFGLPAGVRRSPGGRFWAQLKVNGKQRHLGTFADPHQAHLAWLAAYAARAAISN